MKKHQSIFLYFLVLVLLTGCGQPQSTVGSESPANQQDMAEGEAYSRIYLSMATSGNWSSSFKGKVLRQELERLEQDTDGAMKIKLYDRNRLGDELRIVSGVQLGTLDIVFSSPSTQVAAVPEVALLDVPGLFSSLEEWNALFSGDYQQVIGKYYEDAGLTLLSVFAFSYRQLSSREPVERLADLQGMRVRTIKNKYQEAFWNHMGAVAVPYDFEELYFCLYEQMADAQENLLDTMLEENLVEVQNCITFTNHQPLITVIAMNQETYQALTEEERQALHAFIESLKTQLIEQMPSSEEMLVETLNHDYGVRMIQPSQDLADRIAESRDAVLEMLREDLGEDKVNGLLAAVQAVQQ